MYDYQKALIPTPQKITDGDRRICLGESGAAVFTLKVASAVNAVLASAEEIVLAAITEKGAKTGDAGYGVTMTVDAAVGHPEGYRIEIGDEGTRIIGADAGGVFYGAVTFEKLLYAEDGKLYLPVTTIEDYPDFKERGLFLEDRYGSEFLTLDDYKEAIDYFAKMKYNSLTIGVYGCWGVQYDNRFSEYLYVPISKYPELKTPMSIKYYSAKAQDYVVRENVLPNMFEEDFFGEVIRYAATKNITVRPLFNSQGHNKLIPRLLPELSAKDAEGNLRGVGFCTNNEKTLEFMYGVYDEIIDKYLIPNGIDTFHIGMDEVTMAERCQCEKCRQEDMFDNAVSYVIKLIKHLKSRGMHHIHLYYDTVFGFFRTKGGSYLAADAVPYTQEEVDAAVARTAERFREEGIYDVSIIDWWSYGADEKVFSGRSLNSCFRSVIKPITGYYHWVGPLEYNNNIYGLAKRAEKYGFEGLEAYSSLEYTFDRPYRYLAHLCWNKSQIEAQEAFYDSYAYALAPEAYEQVSEAMAILGDITENNLRPNWIFKLNYYWTSYKRNGLEYPRCYFNDVKNMIDEDPEGILSYLETTKQKAAKCIELLESAQVADAHIKQVHLASAKHYLIHADVYLRLYAIMAGKVAREDVAEQLRAVIGLCEEMLLVAEQTRRPYTLYHYARNISIVRELAVNALARMEELGENFTLAETELLSSDRLNMLR